MKSLICAASDCNQKLKLFIRLDQKGEWRGVEYISSMLGMAEETYFEEGISCYIFDEDCVASLYHYWIDVASMDRSDAEDMQITIFEGNKFSRTGSNHEDLADCERTVLEIDVMPLYEKWKMIEDLYYDDMETDAYDVAEYIEENDNGIYQWLKEMIAQNIKQEKIFGEVEGRVL